MKNTGIARPVDEFGRIVFPVEMRRSMGLNEGDPLEIFTDEEAKLIMLRKYQSQECIFCQSVESLTYFQSKFICKDCIIQLKTSVN